MSHNIVQIQRGNFDFAHSLLLQFIDVCPQDLWVKKFGGWPLWQQVYHALAALEFFVAPVDAKLTKGLVPQEVSNLSSQGQEPVTKEAMQEFARQAKATADQYLETLTDADLSTKAQGASLRMQREITYGNIMIFLTAHIFYHLGTLDAALREQGLAGVL